MPLEIIQLESPEYPVALETAADGGTTGPLSIRLAVFERTHFEVWALVELDSRTNL